MPIKASVVIKILYVSIVHIFHALLVKSMHMINKMEFFVMVVIYGLIDVCEGK